MKVAGFIAALAIGLLPALTAELPLIGDPWSVHDDARQVVYQTRLDGAALDFEGDPNAEHSRIYLPLALTLLYRAVGPMIDALTLTKLLPLVVSPLLALAVFSAGRRLGGVGAGLWSAGALVLVTWTRWPPMWGAGDAGESLPLLQAGMLWALVSERRAAAAAISVVAAHLYPPAFLLVGGTWALSWLLGLRASTATERIRDLAWGVGAALFGGGLLLARSLDYTRGFGPMFTLEEARGMVEFGAEGRTPLFYDDPWIQLTNGRSGLAIDTSVLLLLMAAGLVAFFATTPRNRRPPPLPAALWATLFSGLTWWAVASHLVFLYQPARFAIVSLPLFAAVLFGSRVHFLLGGIQRRHIRWVSTATAMLFGVAYYTPHIYASHVRAEPHALFHAIRALPPGALLAGPPRLLDQVPAFGERRVLVSDEMIAPMFRDRYAQAKTQMIDMLDAYYGDVQTVTAFCERYGVTHWIVDPQDFGDGLHEPYFPPFEAVIDSGRSRVGPHALAPADGERWRGTQRLSEYLLFECVRPPLGQT